MAALTLRMENGDRHCEHGFTNCDPCGYVEGRYDEDYQRRYEDRERRRKAAEAAVPKARPPCPCGGTGRVWGAIGGTWPCRESGCEAGAMEAGAMDGARLRSTEKTRELMRAIAAKQEPCGTSTSSYYVRCGSCLTT